MYGRHHTAAHNAAFGRRPIPARSWYRRPKYNVPVNIAETPTSYEVTVYATGFDKENLKLSVVDDVLYISGTRTLDESNPPNFTKQEFPVKSFERILALNGQVEASGITARQENATLIITLPKSADAQKPVHNIPVS
jgi:HSP20 family protein